MGIYCSTHRLRGTFHFLPQGVVNFQGENRSESHGFIHGHQLVKLVVLLHGAKGLARVRHLVDHVPDLFPLHAAVGTGDIGPNHANGLVLDLQHPDFVAERNVFRKIESIIDVEQFGDVMAFDRFIGLAIGNHVLHDARGQLSERQAGSNPAAWSGRGGSSRSRSSRRGCGPGAAAAGLAAVPAWRPVAPTRDRLPGMPRPGWPSPSQSERGDS